MTAYQLGLYVAIEIGERMVGGEAPGSLTSTTVVLGLAVQPVVAWAALRLLGVGARLLVVLVAPRMRPDRSPSATWNVAPSDVAVVGAFGQLGWPAWRRYRATLIESSLHALTS